MREKKSADMAVLKQILAFIRSQKIDIVHTHPTASAKLVRKKVVVSVQGWIARTKKARFRTAIFVNEKPIYDFFYVTDGLD